MSTTKNIGFFKHDNPATNTDQFNVDKSLNQNWDKADEAFKEDRERLTTLEANNTTNKQDISNIKAEQEVQNDNIELNKSNIQQYTSKLEAENERLREDLSGLPSGQASGENIDISDSADMRFSEFKISGNSKQETRSGKNRLELQNGTFRSSGVTAVVENGKVTLNGTATTTSFATINLAKEVTLLANKQYTLSAFNEDTIGNGSDYGAVRLGSNGDYQTTFYSKNAKNTLNITSESTFDSIVIRTATGLTYNNFVVYPQLEEGNGTDTWEQGGASPSLGYQSKIKCCGDNINIFDKDTVNILNGVVDSSAITSSSSAKSFYLKINPNTTYTISRKVIGARFVAGTTANVPKIGEAIIDRIVGNSVSSITLTTSSNANYLVVYYLYNSTENQRDILSTIKIEEGPATPYSPYGQGCITENICNKNLIDLSKIGQQTSNGITTTYDEEKQTITFNGTCTANNTRFTISDNANILVIKNKTSIVLKYLSGQATGYVVSRCANNNWNFIFNYDLTTLNTDKKVISSIFSGSYTNITYIDFRIDKGAVLNNFTIQMMLTNDNDTDYVEHKSQAYTIPTQQPMRAIGNIRDTFIKKNNKWYERHYIKRLILNGTETYGSYTNTKGLLVSYLTSSNLQNYKQGDLKSNYFTETKTIIGEENKNCIYANTNNIQFINTNVTTIEEFKEWITAQYNAGTPVYVDYLLETPIDIECNEEQSTILWDIEQNAKTYKNITHIYSTDEVSANIDATYKKDIETLIGSGV